MKAEADPDRQAKAMSGAVISPCPTRGARLDRSGDTLIVWKLDRLARSMKQLIETIEKLRLRNISLQEPHGGD